MTTFKTSERTRELSRKYYYQDIELSRERSRNYYYANKEKRKAASENRRRRAENDPHIFALELTRNSKRGAKERNIPFHLTKEDIKGLLIASNGICALSGLPMDTMFNSQMKASIDRIDSSKGYTMDNVQIVAGCVNRAKNALSQKDFVKLCKAVVKVNV